MDSALVYALSMGDKIDSDMHKLCRQAGVSHASRGWE